MGIQLLRAVTEYSGFGTYTKKDRQQITKEALKTSAQTWRRLFLDRHFNRNAASRYGYRERSKKTQRKKQRLAKVGLVEMAGKVDLVHTGRLKRQMKGKKPIVSRPLHATVKLGGPRYFKINYRPGRPNMAAEVTKVIQSEQLEIDAASEARMARVISGLEKKGRRKRRKT